METLNESTKYVYQAKKLIEEYLEFKQPFKEGLLHVALSLLEKATETLTCSM